MVKENKKYRFSIFDAIIIIAVIACIVGIVLRFRLTSSNDFSSKATVEFIVPGVMQSTADSMTAKLKNGTKLYLASSDKEIGYIVSVESERSKVYATSSDGTLERVEHPENYDVKGVCVLYGSDGEAGFLIGGNTLATISEVIYVYSTDVEFSITLTDVSASSPK